MRSFPETFTNMRKILILAALIYMNLAAFSANILEQGYQYTLGWTNPASHIYEIDFVTAPASGSYSDFQVAAWRPGRYYLQDYAAGILNFSAKDDQGKDLAWQKIDNNTWQVQNPSAGNVNVHYEFYANTMDAGSSVLNNSQAYFNPVNFFMHLRDQYSVACTLTVRSMPETWKAATALTKTTGKNNVFTAADYHEFVDCPTILSPSLKTLNRSIEGTSFFFHFQGEFKGNAETEAAYLDNMEKLIREQRAIFGGFPMKEYHFIYQLLPYNMGHAVEHKNSACFAMPNTVAQSAAAIARLNSISAHEFFHLWNVKRIRPAMLWPYDYQREIHTSLHWFTEGVTDYYTTLSLARAGLYSRETFYLVLGRTIQSLESNYASQIVSPCKASVDSWLERSEFTPPYGHISYYTLGTRVGFLLDMKLRADSKGKLSFDDVMLALFKDYFLNDKGIEEDAVQKMFESISGASYAAFFKDFVQGTKPIDYKLFFEPFGLEVEANELENSAWRRVGIEKIQEASEGFIIESVRPATDAANAGLGDGMLVFEVDGKPANDFDAQAYFEKFKKNKRLKLRFASEAGIEEAEIVWTNSYIPKNYTVKEIAKPKAEQKDLLDNWLKSRQ